MQLETTVQMAIKAITANKLRALLTLLGIVVGVSSVVLLIAYSAGVEKEMLKRFDRMGATSMFVSIDWWRIDMTSPEDVTLEDAQAIRADCNGVKNVSYYMSMDGSVEYLDRTKDSVEILAVEAAFIESKGMYEFEYGRSFTKEEVDSREPVCVLGGTVYYDLFFNEPPIDKYVYIEGDRYRVVGSFKEAGGFRWESLDEKVFLPYYAASDRIDDDSWWQKGVFVEASKFDQMPYVEQQVRETLLLRHPKILAQDLDEEELLGDEGAIGIWSSYERRQQRKQTAQSMGRFLIVMGALALLIGGVGVMNIMLVSVEERTPEIGLRKAIGATFGSILMQFLSEAFLICFTGGVLGTIIAIAACRYLERLPDDLQVPDPVITPAAIAVAVSVTLASGVLSGIYPAWRAAELDPIESLRHE